MAAYPKTIYFVDGMVPTAEDYAAAEGIGPGVVFRNAKKIVPGAPLENCDAVAGVVPPDYARVYNVEAGEDNPNILVRPNATVNASSGGPDDFRPGTVHDGLAHESGRGSQFAGDPYAEKAVQRTIQQRAGTPVWEKNPERVVDPSDVRPAYGANLSVAAVPAMGAWPTVDQADNANIRANMAPPLVREIADEMAPKYAEAAQKRREGDEKKAEYDAEIAAKQQQLSMPYDLPGAEPATPNTRRRRSAKTEE